MITINNIKKNFCSLFYSIQQYKYGCVHIEYMEQPSVPSSLSFIGIVNGYQHYKKPADL